MSKINLTDIGSGFNIATRINENNDTIEQAFDNTLSLDGSTPNSMQAALDMNSNRVLNVGSPVAATDAARWADVTSSVTFTGTTVPSQTGNSGKVLTTNGSAASWGNAAVYIPRTASEITAGVIPVVGKENYVEGHVSRYGALGDGSTNDSTAIQQAINVKAVLGGEVTIPAPAGAYYNLGATGLTVPSNVWINGDSSDECRLDYSGTGYAVDLTGAANGLRKLYITCSNVAGNGVRFNGVSRMSGMDRVTIESIGTPAANRVGTGITHRAIDADNAYSGNFLGTNVYSLGFIYGTRYIGFNAGVETWTTVTYLQSQNVGSAALIGSGSRGIWMDGNTNGVGTIYLGGTTEGWGTGILHSTGASCIGFYYRGDLEGNTLDWNLGASFNGVIEAHNAGKYVSKGANGTSNRWFQTQHLNGVLTEETYYGPVHMVYDHGGAAVDETWTRGPESASYISGSASGVEKFKIHMDDSSDQTGDTNYIAMCGHRMGWDSATPAVGTWQKGDIMWNTNAAAGASPGWVCTTGGSPGTWKAMASVAA